MSDGAIVGVGVQLVARAPRRLRALGVGSCLAVSLYDPELRQGGLAHVPLPRRERPEDPPGQYVDTALCALLESLLQLGSRRDRLEAKAAGAASLLRGSQPSRAQPIAELNLRALHETLEALEVPLVASDLGGHSARSVTLDTHTGEVHVLQLPQQERVL